MKNFAALFLTVATLLVGTASNTWGQKPQILNAMEMNDSISIGKPTEERSGDVRFTVSAYEVRYHTYRMTAGERITIQLVGDGDTDLDMYVYSAEGILIDSRESFSDVETSYITAYRSGTITIKVVNRGGVYNNYDISVY